MFVEVITDNPHHSLTIEKVMSKLRPPPPEMLRKLHAHQRYLESGGSKGTRFKGIDLDLGGLNLDGYDFSVGEFDGCSFEGSSLRGSLFIGAFLWRAGFEHSTLAGARFDGADLFETRFIKARYSGASFEGAKIKCAIWTREDEQAVQKSFDSRLKQFFEEQKGRTKADRKADEQHQKEERALAAINYRQEIVNGLKLWRQIKREISTAPEPPKV